MPPAQPSISGIMAPSRMHDCLLVLQVLLGWKYGDSVDEKAKIHPQLRTYKSLTEKVADAESQIQKYWLRDAKT